MGIRHLCDEKIKDEEFDYFINNIGKFEITEKVDGSNLAVGLDLHGVLYMSRDKKDGRRPGRISYEMRRIMGDHFARYMEVVKEFIQTGAISIKPNTEIELEIVDQPISNVVPYDEHQMIVLNVIGNSFEINKETINVNYHGTWSIKMNRPYKIDYEAVQDLFKKDRSRAESLVEMKKLLLDIPSQYGTNNPDSWIEGLVFKHEDMIYKLVNKDRFTIMNKFLHEIRKQLSAPKPSISYAGGLYQEMMAEFAVHYDCGPIATSQKKRWIEKNPSWLENVSFNDQLFFNRNYITIKAIIGKYKKLVNDLESDYNNNYKTIHIDTIYGKCYIDEYTHERNLAAFANFYRRVGIIESTIEGVKNNTAPENLGFCVIDIGTTI